MKQPEGDEMDRFVLIRGNGIMGCYEPKVVKRSQAFSTAFPLLFPKHAPLPFSHGVISL